MADRLFCFCGYPITVEDIMTVHGERQVFSDGKTGRIITGIQACPRCLDWPLDVTRLYAEPAIREAIGDHYKEA